MNKLMLLAATLLTGTVASANTIAVRFQPCSNSPSYICAYVYSDLTRNVNYNQEVGVMIPSVTVRGQIAEMIATGRPSLAMNIEGRVVKVGAISGPDYLQLNVDSLKANSNMPRPRGF